VNCEIYSFGEPLAGFYARDERRLSSTGDFHMTWGGDTSNVAVASAKLGHSAGYITRVGSDAFGRGLIELWTSSGVNIENAIVDEESPTGMYFVSFNGEKHEFDYRRKDAAARKFSPSDAARVSLEGIKILHLSGISQAISRECLEAGFVLMKRAKELGAMVSYDLNYRGKLWSRDLAKAIYLKTICDFADIVSMNDDEAEILNLPENHEEAVRKIMDMGPKTVAFRRGSQGAVLGFDGQILTGKAKRVRVADTVGAGDAFTAAILCCILESQTTDYTLQFALTAAALTCTATGSTDGQPTKKEIRDFLGGNPVTQQ
jgi:2-dehydro-3-deoxygluconokinase